MTALCHAEFALSEADYFLGVLHSEEKAVMAYDGWLVGHAQWFLSNAGRSMLDCPAPPRRSRIPRGTCHSMISSIANLYRNPLARARRFHVTALGIWLTTKRLLICWPVILLADFLYLVVFYQARLFSDALLQVFFIVFTLYGWWHWWRGVREEGDVRVVPLSMRAALVAMAAGALGAVLLGRLALFGAQWRGLPYISMRHSPVTRSSPVGGERASTSPTGGSGSRGSRLHWRVHL